MATLPPKMVHPALLPAYGHGRCLPRQPRNRGMVQPIRLGDFAAAFIGLEPFDGFSPLVVVELGPAAELRAGLDGGVTALVGARRMRVRSSSARPESSARMPWPEGVVRSSPGRSSPLMKVPRSWIRRMISMPSISERVHLSHSAIITTSLLGSASTALPSSGWLRMSLPLSFSR